MDPLQLFNTTMMEFMYDLKRILPDDACIPMYITCLEGIIFVDDTKLIRGFRNNVSLVYGTQILNKDETFFLDHTYDQIALKKNPARLNVGHLITTIKSYWQAMLPENKQTVWKYMRVLCKLCDKWCIDEDLKVCKYNGR